jgi:exodeoxyribonuclease VII small subunit
MLLIKKSMEKNNPTPPVSYDAAYEELMKISQQLESDQISVDLLASQIERAAYLVQYCQEKLRKAESDVQKVMESIKPAQSE